MVCKHEHPYRHSTFPSYWPLSVHLFYQPANHTLGWGAGFGFGLKEVVLSEYGHREQDQFLEEKRKGSRQPDNA
ncbi:hypothetical protein NQZ68_037165 [Dissostichus eleginoides]|nr:hypothetical protein NQZ68_037165 [Dissostichus eleginoides]